jgi:Xaa-Pro aminopeptidase
MTQSPTHSPQLPLEERDQRHAAVRARLKERGVDCVIVSGTDLFYLSNGLPGEIYGLLPAGDEPMMVQLLPRYLVDISVDVLYDDQDWITDIRAPRGTSAVIDRARELRLENGTIGVTRTRQPVGGTGAGFHAQLQKELPGAKLVDVTDIMADLRTIKSEAEIAMIDRANLLFDRAVERMHQVVRPGMTGAAAVQEGIKAMWEAGGDVDSTIGFNFGPVAAENPILWELCLKRTIQPGDMGTISAHSEYGHYAGHSDHELSFGTPRPLHQELWDAVLQVREEVLKAFRPGVTMSHVIDTYKQACTATGFRWSPHAQIHQYGIDVPEFPGPSFQVEGTSEGQQSNYTLQPGMIFSVSPTVVAKDREDRMLGGTTLVITPDGYRELGDRRVELLVADN